MKDPMVLHVDEQDNVIGFVPKLQAHQEGLLHRAVSILLFNEKGEWLLQKRADEKYHSGGLWSNSCCSHPYPHEEVQDAAQRRLIEEMGIDCSLKKMYSFTYRAVLDNELTEHEIDHLFFGISSDLPKINEDEVSEYKYISKEDLEKDIMLYPETYTEWFKIIYADIERKNISNFEKLIHIAS